MYAEPAMVLMDTWSVDAVTAALDGLADRSLVVIQRDEPYFATYYALDVGSVRMALHGVDPEVDLASALGLDVFPANRVVDLEDVVQVEEPPAQGLRPGDVLVQNVVNVLGVVRTDPGEVTTRGDVPSTSPSGLPAGEGERPGPGTGAAIGGTVAAPGSAKRRFRAYAALNAPGAVTVGQRFALSVGFSDHPQTDDEDEQPVIVAGAPPQLTFVVQVAGFGFTFSEGIRRNLTVDRDDPTGVTVEFAVVPTAVNRRATRTIEVSFEYDGERCGQAWQDVVVTKQATDEGSPSHNAG